MNKMEKENIRTEVDDWLNENKLAAALLEKSRLNKKDLKALMIYLQNEDISFEELGSKLGIKRSGAWKRWKKGYEEIMKSFYTLELALYSGVIEPEIAELMNSDLQDYIKLAHEQADIETLQERLELRMRKMDEI